MPAQDAPRFTVLIPTYNRAGLLPRAVASVLAQSFADFELLVVDDHSTDETRQVIASFDDPRLRLVARPENGGAAATRNTGMREARGELVALLDDDDEYLPGFLEETDGFWRTLGSEVGLSWCGIRWVRDSEAGETLLKDELWAPEYCSREDAYLAFLENRHVGTNCGLTFRRQAFAATGGFDEALRGGAEDTEFLIRFVRAFDFAVLQRVLVKVHLHAGANLRSNDARRALDYERIIAKNRSALLSRPGLWAALHYKAGWLHYHGGNRKDGRRLMLAALRRYPLHHKAWLGMLAFETLGGLAPRLHRGLSSLRSRLRRSSGVSPDRSSVPPDRSPYSP